MRPDSRGFTLVELLVALSLLGLTLSTVVAVFSSGLALRAATRERLAFERDARLLVETLRDDLAHLVPSGPAPMVSAEAIVLWRRAPRSADPPRLVSYQWSGSDEQDSLLVRATVPLAVDPADAEALRTEFLRWSRVVETGGEPVPPPVREGEARRFGPRLTLGEAEGAWTAYPRVRACAWGFDDAGGDAAGSRLLLRCAPEAWDAAEPPPDPALRLALVPGDGLEAAYRLPTALQSAVLEAGTGDGEVLP